MTGMGNDGAEAMTLTPQTLGGRTIAEKRRRPAVVGGMPGADWQKPTAPTGILPLQQMAGATKTIGTTSMPAVTPAI